MEGIVRVVIAAAAPTSRNPVMIRTSGLPYREWNSFRVPQNPIGLGPVFPLLLSLKTLIDSALLTGSKVLGP